MKKRWNVHRLIPLPILLGLILACGAVFAYMFMRTDPGVAQFIPAKVTCEVYDEVAGNQLNEVTAKNTGNIPAYLRVRMVTYWVDSDENVVPKPSPALVITHDSSKWLAGSDNTFYYKTMVAPNEVTTDLFAADAYIQLTEDGIYKQRVDVFGEAIQATPAAAATSSWGVTITDGEITAAP